MMVVEGGMSYTM